MAYVKADVTVRQLKSDQAFMNVLNEFSGAVGVWGNCYLTPTFLLVGENTWFFIVFNSEFDVQPTLADMAENWEVAHIYELPTMKEILTVHKTD